MSGNERISRKQERMLQAILLGKSHVEAASACGVAESTIRRWLSLPHIQAERTRREAELATAEQAEIDRILTTGYAAVHNRVKALDDMAHLIEKSYINVETGEVVFQWLLPEKIKEWRGCLDDIAKELGQRVKKQEITGKNGGPVEFSNPDRETLEQKLAAIKEGAHASKQALEVDEKQP